MNRQRLFPTKSRYQVAICLVKLVTALRRASARAEMAEVAEEAAEAVLLSQIANLCYSRLVGLIESVVFEPKASGYDYRRRCKSLVYKHAINNVRGWRKRKPTLLNCITKE